MYEKTQSSAAQREALAKHDKKLLLPPPGQVTRDQTVAGSGMGAVYGW